MSGTTRTDSSACVNVSLCQITTGLRPVCSRGRHEPRSPHQTSPRFNFAPLPRVSSHTQRDLAQREEDHPRSRPSLISPNLRFGSDLPRGKKRPDLQRWFDAEADPGRNCWRVRTTGKATPMPGIRRRACRSWGLSPRPACDSAERGRHCMATRLSAEGLLRPHRL